MNRPDLRPASEQLRPPTPRERVLAAAIEALLGERRAPPPPLVERLLASLSSEPARARRPDA